MFTMYVDPTLKFLAHANAGSHSIKLLVFPQTSFDPLQIENHNLVKMKTLSIMIATIIINISFMESVSQSGVYLTLHFNKQRRYSYKSYIYIP